MTVGAWRTLLSALGAHWRRHPVALVTLVVGLAAATALWSGVQALNAEARRSYDRAAAVAGGDRLAAVVAIDGQPFARDDWLALRRAGWKASPVLEGDLLRGDVSLRVVGIEPVSLPAVGDEAAGLGPGDGFEGEDGLGKGDGPGERDGLGRLRRFILPPGLGLVAPETLPRLAAVAGLPPLQASERLPPDTLVVDIGVAERLLGRAGRVSRALVLPAEAARPLPAPLAARLKVVPPDEPTDIARLSATLHLNLTAFGGLSFVVGLFIVQSAIGLTFEQRKPTLRTLRACGISSRTLACALTLELGGLALVAGGAGMVCGYLIAGALLPDVAASLGGLYGARIPDSLSLGPGWWGAGLVMSLAGALLAGGQSLWRAATLPILATAQPEAWVSAARRSHRRGLAAAGLLLLVMLAALALGTSLAAGFVALGALLLAAALALPTVLAGLTTIGARLSRRALAHWFWADARQGLGGLALALTALLLALAVNFGVGTMVASFRVTFLTFLDQRLGAEIYVRAPDPATAAAIDRWLATRPEVTAVLPQVRTSTRVGDWPVGIVGFTDHATYRNSWPLIAMTPDPWDAVAAGRAVLVSEQLARRLDLWPGATLTLGTPAGPWSLPVAAVYADYGNARGEVMLPAAAVLAHWPEADTTRRAVRLPADQAARLAADLRAALGLDDRTVLDQRAIKELSRRIFEETFAVTVALNALTMIVAGIALVTSLLALSETRLAVMAPLWAAGVPRRVLLFLEMARALGLALLTAVLALPLGLALAWLLTAVVNVRAFGWRLPVLLLPGQGVAILLLALATAFVAALWPTLRLARTTPRALSQGFAHDR